MHEPTQEFLMSVERVLQENIDSLQALGTDAPADSVCHILDGILQASESSHGAKRLLMEISNAGELFLQFLSHEDAHVKYNVLQLIRVLYRSNSVGTVSSLLKNPDRLTLVVDLLNPDSVPFVRNEALCVVEELSGDANPDLPTILAFQGIADSLFSILMDDTSLTDNATAFQALDTWFRLCASEKSSRYIRESGGCDMLSELVSFFMQPVLDHAEGVGDTEDVALMEQRIENGWKQTEKALDIARELVRFMESPEMKNVFVSTGLVSVLMVCGESLYLSSLARGLCYEFIGLLVSDCRPIGEYFFGESGDFNRMYTNLVEERTPLEVRVAIDGIVRELLSFDEIRDSELGQFGDISGEGTQSPGKIAYSIIAHAACNVPMGIPDGSALASQLWFALRTVSHLGRSSPDLQIALSRVRISEDMRLLEAIVGLSKKENSPAVNCGALQLLAEWIVGNPAIVDKIVVEEIDLLRRLVSEVKRDMVDGVVDVYVIFLACVVLRSSDVSEAVVDSVGPVLMYRQLSQVEKRYANRRKAANILRLPIVHACEFIPSVFPPVKSIVLRRCLNEGNSASPESAWNISEELSKEVKDLKQRLSRAEMEIADYRRINAFGAVRLVEERNQLQQILTLLREELLVGGLELQRVELARTAEVDALRKLVDDQHSQIQALVASYNQLNELCQSPSDVQSDLLELLRAIRAKFPETAVLLDPVGIFQIS